MCQAICVVARTLSSAGKTREKMHSVSQQPTTAPTTTAKLSATTTTLADVGHRMAAQALPDCHRLLLSLHINCSPDQHHSRQ